MRRHAYPSFHTHIRFVCTLKLYSLILWESKTTNLPMRTYKGSKLHKIFIKILLQKKFGSETYCRNSYCLKTMLRHIQAITIFISDSNRERFP